MLQRTPSLKDKHAAQAAQAVAQAAAPTIEEKVETKSKKKQDD